MSRSRKGLFGLLALAVVMAVGLGGCSDPGVEGWHDVRPEATPFAYGPAGCTYQLSYRSVTGGTEVFVKPVLATTPCNTAAADIKVTEVSCMYDGGANGWLVTHVDGNLCPSTKPGGTEPYMWVNAGYARPPFVNS